MNSEELAQRYRPYVKLGTEQRLEFTDILEDSAGGKLAADSIVQEQYAPCSWQWFYDHSLLQLPSGDTVDIRRNHSDVLKHCDIRSNTNNISDDTCVVIGRNFEKGEHWGQAVKGDGFYCHCTEIKPGLFNLEYWILFAYNKTTVFGNHKGDLVCVQMVYDDGTKSIIRVTYSIHGQALEAFDLRNSQVEAPIILQGINITGEIEKVEARKHVISPGAAYQQGDYGHSPSDGYLYFMKAGDERDYLHLVVFLEWGTHEPWPNTTGGFPTSPKHNGEGYSFLPGKVTVLNGQNDAPFIFFGGKLGDPVAPMRHRSWLQNNPAIRVPPDALVDKDPYVTLGPIPWPP
jgi:hypothetical protein